MESSGPFIFVQNKGKRRRGRARGSSGTHPRVRGGAGEPAGQTIYPGLKDDLKYDWLRPKLEEIDTTYMKLYGKESRDSDGSSGTGGLEEEGGD